MCSGPWACFLDSFILTLCDSEFLITFLTRTLYANGVRSPKKQSGKKKRNSCTNVLFFSQLKRQLSSDMYSCAVHIQISCEFGTASDGEPQFDMDIFSFDQIRECVRWPGVRGYEHSSRASNSNSAKSRRWLLDYREERNRIGERKLILSPNQAITWRLIGR